MGILFIRDLCGHYINIDAIEYITDDPMHGLNLYAYCANNPVMYVDPTGNSVIAFLVGIAVSGLLTWGISAAFGAQVAGGIGSIMNGASAIGTGISLLAFGPIGWLFGGVLIAVGASTVAFGVNDVIAGVSGTNYFSNWMGEDIYIGLNIGLNIASAVGSIAGGLYMRYASVNQYGRSISTVEGAKPYQRYSLIDDKGIKQYRFFDKHGNAWYDKDFRHGGNLKFPHYHGWENGTKLKGHWSFFKLLKWMFGG